MAKGRVRSVVAGFLASARVALGMFSRIPVGAYELAGPGMRHAIALWPLVGVVQAAGALAWGVLAGALGLPTLAAGAVLALLPPLVNGGIHFDGLADTSDALAAHTDAPRSLAIMADAHVGSFAVLTLAAHVALGVTLAASVCWTPRLLVALGCTYVLSRALAGYTVVRWPQAHAGGLAATFADAARGTRCHVALAAWALAAAAGGVAAAPLPGALACAGAAAVLAWYRRSPVRRLGGVTGDTSGWFVQTCELVCLGALVLGVSVGGAL